MAQFDLNKSTTVGLTEIPDFIMDAKALDVDNDNGETTYYFENAVTDLGYYANDPIVFSAANGLATWGFKQGWTSDNPRTVVEFEHFTGRGNDTFAQIMWNHEVMKLVIGDAFAEIVRSKNILKSTIINLLPISPERVRIISKDGRILRYEVWNSKTWKKLKVRDMYHSSNKRIGDQIHGTSQITAIRKSIDARQEAEADERVIKHRDKALGIAEYQTNNEGKITFANAAIKKGVEDGDMIGVSAGTVKILPFPSKGSEDRQNWIQSRENHTYASLGVPRNMITADGTTEVGAIGGHLIFEVSAGAEALEEEQSIWNQLARRINFTRSISLAPQTQANQEANTGTTKIQPAEVEPKLNR